MKKLLTVLLFLSMTTGASASQLLVEAPFFTMDDDGTLCNACVVHTYECGTTTNKATYTEAALTNAHTNPVVLGSDARSANPIFYEGCIKYVLKDAASGNTVDTVDNYYGMGASPPDGVNLSDYTDLAAAVTAIGATTTTLWLDDSGTQTMDENVAFPATLSVVALKGCVLTLSTYTLTINGSFSAGLHQVFSENSTGTVVFGETSRVVLLPEWWGENTTPGTTDMTAEIQSACTAVQTNGGIVQLQAADYYISDTVEVTSATADSGVIFRGMGQGRIGTIANHATRIINDNDDHALEFANIGSTVIENLSIVDNLSGAARTSGAGIYGSRPTGENGTVSVIIRNFHIEGHQDGINIVRSQNTTINHGVVYFPERSGVRFDATASGSGTSSRVVNVFVHTPGQDGFYLDGHTYVKYESCSVDYATRYSYYANTTQTAQPTAITYTACGSEESTDDAFRFTDDCYGIVLVGCFATGSDEDAIQSKAFGLSLIGGKYTGNTGYGLNNDSGVGVALVGVEMTSNTAGNVNGVSNVLSLGCYGADNLLMGHIVSTGANDADIVLKNSSAIRWLNNAGTTSANMGIRNSTGDDLIYAVPATGDINYFSWAGTNRMQMGEENGAYYMRILGEASGDMGNPAANQAKIFLLDNGAGKTQLMVRFGSGASQVIATEP